MTVKTLREYGIYNMLQQSVNPSHFIKMRVVTYRDSYIDFGIIRCFICFNNYKEGDRLKQFPFCKHVCHIKCLELWMSFEAKCPECNKTFPGIERMLEYQANTSEQPLELEGETGFDPVQVVGHSMSPASAVNGAGVNRSINYSQ